MEKSMNKTALIAAMAEGMGTTHKVARAALDTLAEIITSEVRTGGTILLPGVVKISVRSRAERNVRNPATGEVMVKPADKAVKATVVKALKDVAQG
ncbi:HU family DNA-binding protein [Pararhodobacter sp.]|uniref:HU family DNA-binding protein n=1 Tax=Pararhodobacter sp. TaxID=2127056 RepID=UPI002FDD069A